MDKIIEENINELKALCKKYSVKTLSVFGSVCHAGFSRESDIDLLVAFNPMSHEDYADNYFELIDKLEALFGRSVDLVTENSLSNPYFIDSVNNSKQLIYEK